MFRGDVTKGTFRAMTSHFADNVAKSTDPEPGTAQARESEFPILKITSCRRNKNGMDNLYAIFAFGIDIDYHSKKTYRDFSPLQMLALLEQEILGFGIPHPNYVEYGNNLRLIYILNE